MPSETPRLLSVLKRALAGTHPEGETPPGSERNAVPGVSGPTGVPLPQPSLQIRPTPQGAEGAAARAGTVPAVPKGQDRGASNVLRRPESGPLYELLIDGRLLTLVSQVKTLPSQPTKYLDVYQETLRPEASAQSVGRLIEQDIGLSAQVLRMVNSAYYYGLARKIANPTEAVVVLGLDTIRSLVLSANVFDEFSRLMSRGHSFKNIHAHSLHVAAFSKRIAHIEQVPTNLVDECFTGGLLHDVGKLVLAANLPDEFERANAMATGLRMNPLDAERQVFGTTHAEVGAYLLDMWKLPTAVVEAVAFHHHPRDHDGKGFGALPAVYVADRVEHWKAENLKNKCPLELDSIYLGTLGLAERSAAWPEKCLAVEPLKA